MKKKLYTALYGLAILGICTSCGDYLETDSASTVDGNFVMSSQTNISLAMNGAYETVHRTKFLVTVCGMQPTFLVQTLPVILKHFPTNLVVTGLNVCIKTEHTLINMVCFHT